MRASHTPHYQHAQSSVLLQTDTYSMLIAYNNTSRSYVHVSGITRAANIHNQHTVVHLDSNPDAIFHITIYTMP
jgi:hypothetical protein